MAEDEGMRINEREVSAIFGSFRPVKESDEERGIFVPFMKMNCYICKSEHSLIMLLDDKGKIVYQRLLLSRL